MRKSALYLLGLVVAALVTLGLVVLFSASEVRSIRQYGRPWMFVARQAAYVVGGVILAVFLARFDYRRWREHWLMTVVFGGCVLLALLAVFLFPAVKGSHRWIPLGGVNFQPGEFAKLATVICTAVCLDRASWQVELFKRGTLMPSLVIATFALPVMLEPDFGSVMVIGAVGFMLMVMAGSRILHMIPIGLAGLGVVAWEVMHNANRMARIAAYVSGAASDDASAASADPAAYQATMSIVAISRGSIFGVGLERSMQKHNYLPEAWTDFIFAVGAEELGMIFSVAVILLFLMFFGLSIYIACKAQDRLGKLLVMGMSTIIFFQAMFNIGVVCEAYPTKGMALPFFSYGGTNMLSAFFAVGVIFSVGIRAFSDTKQDRPFKRSILAN